MTLSISPWVTDLDMEILAFQFHRDDMCPFSRVDEMRNFLE